MNYSYKVGGNEYILSEKEHKQVSGVITSGEKGHAVLRGGNLIINIAMVSSAEPTEKLTEEQELEKRNRLKLGEGEVSSEDQERIKKTLAKGKEELSKKLGWE